MRERTKLSIIYPRGYSQYFEPLCDFETIDLARVDFSKDLVTTGRKPIWLDARCLTSMPESGTEAYDGYIMPLLEDPDQTILKAVRHSVDGAENVVLWTGTKRHLDLIQEAGLTVGLPYWKHPRTYYVTEDNCHLFHYYEFCNIDELRRLPPKSLQTSIPIVSALMGIDLSRRERRPKRLPEFSYDLQLNDEQLELAISNVQAIRNALEDGHARLDSISHS